VTTNKWIKHFIELLSPNILIVQFLEEFPINDIFGLSHWWSQRYPSTIFAVPNISQLVPHPKLTDSFMR